jgi:hypothetical protein
MAVMVRNIHFGGALPGIASSRFSQSMAGIFGPRHLASTPSTASTAATATTFSMSPS